jgi:hypothetical protein
VGRPAAASAPPPRRPRRRVGPAPRPRLCGPCRARLCGLFIRAFRYWGQKSFFGGEPILPSWSGYLIVVLFGVFFSGVTTAIVHLEQKFAKTKVRFAACAGSQRQRCDGLF